MRCAGVLATRNPGADGRRGWTADELDEAVRDFAADRVPLLAGHNGRRAAPVVGRLDRLWRTPEGLRYGGVLEDEVMIARLRLAGALAVSVETPVRGRSWNPIRLTKPAPPGYLSAVAILVDGEEPAYRGSLLWIDEAEAAP